MSDDEADRARLLGRISLGMSAVAIFLLFFDLSPGRNPQAWEFLLSTGIAIVGVVIGLAGLDRRRASPGPKPGDPVAGVIMGLGTAAVTIGLVFFVAGIRHI